MQPITRAHGDISTIIYYLYRWRGLQCSSWSRPYRRPCFRLRTRRLNDLVVFVYKWDISVEIFIVRKCAQVVVGLIKRNLLLLDDGLLGTLHRSGMNDRLRRRPFRDLLRWTNRYGLYMYRHSLLPTQHLVRTLSKLRMTNTQSVDIPNL